MKKKTLLAPAKINLLLEVVGKRSDGYHNICSLVDIIDLADFIEFEPAEMPEIHFIGPWKIPVENTVSKAVRILNARFPQSRPYPYRITIHKKIPPGSGLGGASSDAATVVKFLVGAWSLHLAQETLLEICAEIGADVPLFLYGRPSVITGKGERISPIPTVPGLRYLIFTPPYRILTKTVYERLSTDKIGNLTEAESRIKILLQFWRSCNVSGMREHLFNRLQEVTFTLRPELKETKRMLEKQFGRQFFLTGSGGGLFCPLNPDEPASADSPKSLRLWRRFEVQSLQQALQKEDWHGNHGNQNIAHQ